MRPEKMNATYPASEAFDAGYEAGFKAAEQEHENPSAPSVGDDQFDVAVRHREVQNRCQEDVNNLLDELATPMAMDMDVKSADGWDRVRERLEDHWTRGREEAIKDFIELHL